MGFLGLVLYLFGSIIRPADWYGPILGQPTDWYIAVIIVAGIIFTSTRHETMAVLKSTDTKRVLLYVLAMLVSVALANPTDLLDRLFIHARLLFAYLAFAIFADSADRIRRLLLAIVVMAGFVAYQGVGLVQTGMGVAGQGLYWGGRIRWVGMYDGANVLCMLFVIAIAFAIHLAIGPWRPLTRVIGTIAGGFLIYGIYLTQSRGGFLAFALVVAMSYVLTRQRIVDRIKVRHLVVAGLAVVLLMFIAPSRMGEINDDAHSASGRIDSWQEGIEMLRHNPVLGVGDGQWQAHHYLLAHNSFVQTMGQAGLIGLYAWLAFVYGVGKGLLTNYLKASTPTDRSLASALLAGFSGFLLCSWFVTTTQFDLLYIFAGFACSLLLVNPRQVKFERTDLFRIGAIEIAGLVLIWLTVRVFYAMA